MANFQQLAPGLWQINDDTFVIKSELDLTKTEHKETFSYECKPTLVKAELKDPLKNESAVPGYTAQEMASISCKSDTLPSEQDLCAQVVQKTDSSSCSCYNQPQWQHIITECVGHVQKTDRKCDGVVKLKWNSEDITSAVITEQHLKSDEAVEWLPAVKKEEDCAAKIEHCQQTEGQEADIAKSKLKPQHSVLRTELDTCVVQGVFVEKHNELSDLQASTANLKGGQEDYMDVSSIKTDRVLKQKDLECPSQAPGVTTSSFSMHLQEHEVGDTCDTVIQRYQHPCPQAELSLVPVSEPSASASEEVNQDKVTVSTKKNRDWDKKHACVYCKKLVNKMSTHLQRVHKNEEEVARILGMRKGSPERRNAFVLLLQRGDHQHNVGVLKKKRGTLIPKYRCRKKRTVKHITPCPFCKAMYKTNLLSMHTKRCNQLHSNPSSKCRKTAVTEERILTQLPDNVDRSFGVQAQERMSELTASALSTPLKKQSAMASDGHVDSPEDTCCSNENDGRCDIVTHQSQCPSPHVQLHLVPVSNKPSASASEEVNQDKVTVSTKKDSDWDKKHACVYCKKLVTKMSTHLQRVHKNEAEVARILAMKKGSAERRNAFVLLLQRGDYQHNVGVLKKKRGTFIPKYRHKTERTVKQFTPCPVCKGMYKTNLLNMHVKRCNQVLRNLTSKSRQFSLNEGKMMRLFPRHVKSSFAAQVQPRIQKVTALLSTSLKEQSSVSSANVVSKDCESECRSVSSGLTVSYLETGSNQNEPDTCCVSSETVMESDGPMDTTEPLCCLNENEDTGDTIIYQVQHPNLEVQASVLPVPEPSASAEEAKQDEITVSTEKDIERYKKHACVYCKKLVSKMSKHLQGIHKKEEEVARILAMKKGSAERRNAFVLLLQKGDYQHNSNVIEKNKGTFIPKYRCKTERTVEQFTPCPVCKGMYKTKQLSNHTKRCSQLHRHSISKCRKAAICPVPENVDRSFAVQVLARMTEDEIKRTILKDSLILKYGECSMAKKDVEEHTANIISARMRLLGRLLLEIQKASLAGKEITNLFDALHPSNLELLVKCVKTLSGYNESTHQFSKASIALTLGYAIKQCYRVLHSTTVQNGSATLNEQTEVLDSAFSDLLSFAKKAAVTPRMQKHFPKLLPSCADVEKLWLHLMQKAAADSSLSYAALTRRTLCAISLFNRKRGQVVQRMKVDEFEKGLKNSKEKEIDSCIKCTMSRIELRLAEFLERIEISGMQGRRTAILLTPQMKRDVEKIMQLRKTLSLSSPYLFVSEKGSRPYRSIRLIRQFAHEAGISKSVLFTKANLRRQLATIVQAMAITDKQQNLLTRFMDQDMLVDEEVNQLPLMLPQKVKVAKFFLAANRGGDLSTERLKEEMNNSSTLDQDEALEEEEEVEMEVCATDAAENTNPVKDSSACSSSRSVRRSPQASKCKIYISEILPNSRAAVQTDSQMDSTEVIGGSNEDEDTSDTIIYQIQHPNLEAQASFLAISEPSPSAAEETNQDKVTVYTKKGGHWTKKHACVYCKKLVTKMSKHLRLQHRYEEEVARILVMKKGSAERRAAFVLLQQKGDYQHNYNVLKKNKGTFIPKYRCKTERTVEQFTPCPVCKGMYKTKQLSNHTKRCSQLHSHPISKCRMAAIIEGRMLRPVPDNVDRSFAVQVLARMTEGKLKRTILKDSLILKYGECSMAKKDVEEHTANIISARMRLLGRLLLEIQQASLAGEKITNLFDALHPSNLELLVKCVKRLSGYNESTHQFSKASIAVTLGYAIKQCYRVLHSTAVQNGSATLKEQTEVLDSAFSDLLSSAQKAAAMSRMQKHKPKLLPSCADVEKLWLHLMQKAAADSSLSYAALTRRTLCAISLFNSKRGQEVERMKADEFEKGLKNSKEKEIDSCIKCTMSRIELRLAEFLERIEISGMQGRRTAILLTPQMKRDVEKIMQLRKTLSLSSPYLFVSEKGSRPYRSSHVIQQFANEAGVSKSMVFTQTNLRRQLATIVQAMAITDKQQNLLTRFMDQDMLVDEEVNQLPLMLPQKVKVAKFFLAANRGGDLSTERLKEEMNNSSTLDQDEAFEEEASIIEGTENTDKEKVCSAQGDLSAQRKKKRAFARKPWNEDEKAAVHRQLQSCISTGKVPTKSEAESAIWNEPALAQRDWRTVKFFVYNLNQKRAKRWKSTEAHPVHTVPKSVSMSLSIQARISQKSVHEEEVEKEVCATDAAENTNPEKVSSACSSNRSGRRSPQASEPKVYISEILPNSREAVQTDSQMDSTEVLGGSNEDEDTSDTIIYQIQHPNLEVQASFLAVSEPSLSAAEEMNQDKVTVYTKKGGHWTKKHACVYCKKLVTKMSKHLRLQHRDEEEVARILVMKKGSAKRRAAFVLLQQKGDYQHNYNVLEKNKGAFIPKYRCKTERTVEQFTPCPICKGMYKANMLSNHTKRCSQLHRHSISKCRKAAICPVPENVDRSFAVQVLARMTEDEIKRTILKDSLILKYGECSMAKKDVEEHTANIISARMRLLGRLLLEIQKASLAGKEITNLFDALHPSNLELLVKCVKRLSGYNESTHQFSKASIAVALGYAIKQCYRVLHSTAVQNGSATLKEQTEVLDSAFSDLLSFAKKAAVTSRMQKHFPKLLPSCADVEKLWLHLMQKAAADSSLSYAALTRRTLCAISLFNSKRGQEVERMKADEFERGLKNSIEKEIDSCIKCTMSSLELRLAEFLERIEISGTQGKRTAILLTPQMKRDVEKIMQLRKTLSLSSPYLFVSEKGSRPYRSSRLIQQFANEAGISKSMLFTQTNLRRQLATIVQAMAITDKQQNLLARFMDQDMLVDEEVNQLPLMLPQKVKVAKFFLAANRGGDLSTERLKEEMNNSSTLDQDEAFEEEASIIEGTENTDKEKVCSAQGDLSAQRKKKRAFARKPWNEDEKAAVHRQLQSCISTGKVPTKSEAESAIWNEPALAQRDWRTVKFFVYNLNQKRAKRWKSTG